MRGFFNRLFRNNEERQDSERFSGSQGTAAETEASDIPTQTRPFTEGERFQVRLEGVDSDSDVDFNEDRSLERNEAVRVFGSRPATGLQNTRAELSARRSEPQQGRE